jgi:hypothetical protein
VTFELSDAASAAFGGRLRCVLVSERIAERDTEPLR